MCDSVQNDLYVFNDMIKNLLGLMNTEDLTTAQENACTQLKLAFKADEVLLWFQESPQEGDAAAVIKEEAAVVINLHKEKQKIGQCLIRGPRQIFPDDQMELLSTVLSSLFDFVIRYARINKQLYGLNRYLDISSNIQNSLNLNEQLQWVIYLCMDAVNASAASVLLLTQDEQELEFFAVEGEACEALSKFTMPIDKGIAGFVLKNQTPVIINDCKSSPYFYDQVDSNTGFTTRNIIAAPLIAGEQLVGVIEVLNKNDGLDFVQSDADLVQNIANEVSFAVRNARIFEYVVATYCKILQGHSNCIGCKRPLRNWTPCRRQLSL